MQIQNINNYQNKKYNNPSFKMNIEIYQKADRKPLELDEFKKAFLNITKDVPGKLELFDKKEILKICYTDALGNKYGYEDTYRYKQLKNLLDSNIKNDESFIFRIFNIIDDLADSIVNKYMKDSEINDQVIADVQLHSGPHEKLFELRDKLHEDLI